MIGSGYLIYIFPGIHFEQDFFPRLPLNQFLNSSKVHIDNKEINKICAKFDNAENDINIMLCCISRIGVMRGLNATFFSFFGF
jgi:hypothetical protein